ncbi:DUF2147 domain-containing protein [Cytophagaceae bacterium ABcell3]|nr:DUF2147 domain-containing protein [Cytophagaceae bacterium ABcell3]
MKNFIKPILAFAAILLISLEVSAAPTAKSPEDVIGLWKTSSGDGIVETYKENDKFFGKIVWIKEPKDKNGNPKTDLKNPNQKLQKEPIVGLVNLKDFKFNSNGKWEDGKIYDPSNGKEYSCEMKLSDEETLEVRGYMGFTWIGRTEVWKKQTQLP